MRIGIEAQVSVSLRWDEPAHVFVSYAPALDIYSQAPTHEGALRAIESAIRLHLVTALEVDKLDEVIKRFRERVSSGIGPEPLTPRQYITVHQGSGCEIKALPPLALAQG
jgi:predicted RNase H-like HicB family nuclease